MNIQTKVNSPSLRPGLSAVELAIVILVLLTLVGILFTGVKIYKNGADRAACVMNIHSLQNAVRLYSNLNGLAPGQQVGASVNLRGELVGAEGYVEDLAPCPGGGDYSNLGNRIPSRGELYLACSLAEDQDHVPNLISSW